MKGNYIQKALDDADSLRKLSDSLSLELDSLQKKSSENIKNLSSDISLLKNSTIYLSIGLLIFGLILILSILYFLFKIGKGFGNYAFQTIGLVIVVVGALFLIVTAYDKDQITPIIGLLGTIVGFIFGSNLSSKTDDKSKDKEEGK